MNLGLVHPYLSNFFIYILLPIWVCWGLIDVFKKFLKKLFKSYFDSLEMYIHQGAILALSVYVPILISFYLYAGFIFSIQTIFDYLFFGMLFYYYHFFFFKARLKLTFNFYIPTFAVSTLILLIYFSEDNIYRLSKNCKNSNLQNIKICTYTNGYYLGELKAFKRHGIGKYYWNNGSTYEGNWKNNKKHGSGKTVVDGRESVDNWIKGKKIN